MTTRPMFPLEAVRLPGEELALRIFEPRYGALVRECLSDAREFGVVLIAGRWLRVTSTVTSLLLLVFFSLIVRAALKGQEISCGCFGPGETISWKTMLRDGSMLAGSLLVTAMAFLRPRRSPLLEPASLQPRSTPPELAPNFPSSESQSRL